jgi:hypothetical protein
VRASCAHPRAARAGLEPRAEAPARRVAIAAHRACVPCDARAPLRGSCRARARRERASGKCRVFAVALAPDSGIGPRSRQCPSDPSAPRF